jgi:(2Fe-2S) ferredoxin
VKLVSGRELAQIVQRRGWKLARIHSSHHIFTKRLLSDLAADLWPLTSGSAYSTLTSLQRKRYLFVCINRRAEDNPKGCCAAKDSEEVHRALKAEVAARGLAKLEARVCTSSCLDQCATGVTVLVEPDHFFYGRVTVADVPEIVDALVKGQPVKRLLLTADRGKA